MKLNLILSAALVAGVISAPAATQPVATPAPTPEMRGLRASGLAQGCQPVCPMRPAVSQPSQRVSDPGFSSGHGTRQRATLRHGVLCQ